MDETNPVGAQDGASAAAASNGGASAPDALEELFAGAGAPREAMRELGLIFRSVEGLETKVAGLEAELAILIGLSLCTLAILTLLVKQELSE